MGWVEVGLGLGLGLGLGWGWVGLAQPTGPRVSTLKISIFPKRLQSIWSGGWVVGWVGVGLYSHSSAQPTGFSNRSECGKTEVGVQQ